MDQMMDVHPAERKLILLIRDVGFGAIKEITVHDGLPQYVTMTEERKIRMS